MSREWVSTRRMRGDGDVVSGRHNKLQSAIANVTPAAVLAERHRRMAEPGSGKQTAIVGRADGAIGKVRQPSLNPS
jgi:hypothetical protein